MIDAKQVKEHFTYGSSVIEESFDVAGVSVEIWHDQDKPNPYKDWDCMAPALWIIHGLQEYGGYDLESVIWRMTPGFVSRHWRTIAAVLDVPESTVEQDCAETQADYGGGMSDIRRDYFGEALQDLRAATYGAGGDYLETLASLYRLMGIDADTRVSTGYCQGDVARGLIVHLPEWKEKGGFGGDAASDMDSEAKVFGAWLWGDCYGFTVDDEDSCGGFFGHDADHLAAEIADSVNAVLKARAAEDAAAMQAARPDMTPAYA